MLALSYPAIIQLQHPVRHRPVTVALDFIQWVSGASLGIFGVMLIQIQRIPILRFGCPLFILEFKFIIHGIESIIEEFLERGHSLRKPVHIIGGLRLSHLQGSVSSAISICTGIRSLGILLSFLYSQLFQ